LIQHAQNNFPGAIASYTQAIQSNPDKETALSAYLNRGFAYSNLGNTQAAIADYNEVLRLDPNNAQAYAERADIRSEAGDMQGALEDYNQAIALNPYSAYAYNNRAFILNRQDDFFGAALDLQRASQLLLDSGQMMDYQVVINNLKKMERNERNLAIIRDWGLTLATCGDRAVSILIDANKYCTEPVSELAIGTYKYIRSEDRLEPIAANSSDTLAVVPKFTFTSLKGYGDCLEDIIRFYENTAQFQQNSRMSDCLPEIFQTYASTGISQSQALDLISAADAYATSRLASRLFPFPGQRRRINRLFGFTYEIDMNSTSSGVSDNNNSGF
jgi:hypothetical protein